MPPELGPVLPLVRVNNAWVPLIPTIRAGEKKEGKEGNDQLRKQNKECSAGLQLELPGSTVTALHLGGLRVSATLPFMCGWFVCTALTAHPQLRVEPGTDEVLGEDVLLK